MNIYDFYGFIDFICRRRSQRLRRRLSQRGIDFGGDGKKLVARATRFCRRRRSVRQNDQTGVRFQPKTDHLASFGAFGVKIDLMASFNPFGPKLTQKAHSLSHLSRDEHVARVPEAPRSVARWVGGSRRASARRRASRRPQCDRSEGPLVIRLGPLLDSGKSTKNVGPLRAPGDQK